MRIASPVVTAMAPSEIVPWLQSQSDSPVVPVIRAPVRDPLRQFEAGDQPELVPELLQVIGDRFLGVGVLAFGMGEQLDGQNVGVAIDDPPDQQRARFRKSSRPFDQLRHKEPDHGQEAREPSQKRHEQARVELEEDHSGAGPINRDVPKRVHGLDHRLPHRAAGLHDLVGDPAREVVLEERQALPQDVTVLLPAHHVHDIGVGSLIDEHRVHAERQGPGHHGDERHPKQRPAMQLEEFGGVRGSFGEIHDLADKSVKRDLDERSQHAKQHDERIDPPNGPQIVPVKCPKLVRRLDNWNVFIGIDKSFEPG